MPPKHSTASKRKKAAALSQPTLSFSARKPSIPEKLSKPPILTGSQVRSTPTRGSTASLQPTASESSVAGQTEDDLIVPEESANVKRRGKAEKGDKAEKSRLEPNSREWDGLMRDAKTAMGGLAPIHAGPDTHNNIHHILRVFDMTSKYGPFVGITRLQRWERAKKWGLNPPDEIRRILTTVEGEEDASYRENVLHTWL